MDFFGSNGKQKQKTKLSLQVSLGPMIFPESYEETTPMNDLKVKAQKYKAKSYPKATTTKESPDYEEYHESEEEILSEGYNPTTTSTAKPRQQSFGFFQQLKERFPKVHDWLSDDQDTAGYNRQPRMPKTFNLHHKKKHQKHKHKPKTTYGVPKKPKVTLTPPKKFAPARRPVQAHTTKRPKQVTTPAFEQEEDIQATGFTEPPLRRPPPKRKPKPVVKFEQYPAESFQPFEQEQDIQPGGQNPRPTNGYSYPKPQKVTRKFSSMSPHSNLH